MKSQTLSATEIETLPKLSKSSPPAADARQHVTYSPFSKKYCTIPDPEAPTPVGPSPPCRHVMARRVARYPHCDSTREVDLNYCGWGCYDIHQLLSQKKETRIRRNTLFLDSQGRTRYPKPSTIQAIRGTILSCVRWPKRRYESERLEKSD